jgi:hypothetical protein
MTTSRLGNRPRLPWRGWARSPGCNVPADHSSVSWTPEHQVPSVILKPRPNPSQHKFTMLTDTQLDMKLRACRPVPSMYAPEYQRQLAEEKIPADVQTESGGLATGSVWVALTRRNSHVLSRMWQMGFRKTPVDSTAAWATPSRANQSAPVASLSIRFRPSPAPRTACGSRGSGRRSPPSRPRR